MANNNRITVAQYAAANDWAAIDNHHLGRWVAAKSVVVQRRTLRDNKTLRDANGRVVLYAIRLKMVEMTNCARTCEMRTP